MPIEILKDGIISRKTEGSFRYHAWGTVARMTDGTLAAGISAGRHWHLDCFGKTYLFLSRDEGETWSCPILVNDTWMDDRDVGVVALPNNGLMVTWFTGDYDLVDSSDKSNREHMTEGEYEMIAAYKKTAIVNPDLQKGCFCRVSHDGGLTWSEIRRIPTAPPHGPSVMNDGSIMAMGKTPNGMSVWRSADEGLTWELMGDVPVPEGYTPYNMYEAHICQLPSGKIMGVIRFEHHAKCKPEGTYPQNIMFTHSLDGGHTWSVPEYYNCHGGPGFLSLHSSGALLCTYCRRDIGFLWYGPGERVLVSWDEGETWTEDSEFSRAPNDWDMGYPSTVELSDGTLLSAYYQKWQDVNDFNKADTKPSFLWTKWKLK